MSQKILFSGIKPTGRVHIGNYFGAMKQFTELQDKFDSYICIVDYHALTTLHNAKELSSYSLDLAIDFLAMGLNPNKVTLFRQSEVPQVCELAWIFNCITTMPFLERAHAYKDAVSKGREISVGTFDYPMLMAADILLYDTDIVPVGQDQKQHVEYARDTAEKFNRTFSETFKLPQPLILDSVATVPGTDGKKMSKSYNNTIPLFAEDDEIENAVLSIVTDSGSGIPQNVMAIHKLFKNESELADLYEANMGKYKILKDSLISDMKSFIKPMRERRKELSTDLTYINKILSESASKAEAKASTKMESVKKSIGLSS